MWDNRAMKFVAAFFWWQHRHRLKARGYSLRSFCAITSTYWNTLIEDRAIQIDGLKPPTAGITDAFSRNQLRARW
jgi:hypothetical protein